MEDKEIKKSEELRSELTDDEMNQVAGGRLLAGEVTVTGSKDNPLATP